MSLYLHLPVSCFVMDDHQQQHPSGGSIQDSVAESILWDLDSSSLVVPPVFQPAHNMDTMRREISEESGYQTASGIDEGSSSFTDNYWFEDPTEWSQNQPADWFQWPENNHQLINQQSTPNPAVCYYPAAGRRESSSSEDSNQVCVPSGNK